MSEKYKKTCMYMNYVENLLILASAITGCISISAFASLVGVSLGITNFAGRTKICAITAGLKSIDQLSRKRRKSMIK